MVGYDFTTHRSLWLVALLLSVGCQHSEPPPLDTEELALRDLLGMEPSWLEALDAERKLDVQARINAGSLEGDGWLEGWIDTETPVKTQPALQRPYDQIPEDPLNSLRDLDFWRQDEGRDAWLFGVFVAEPGIGVRTLGCTPKAGELEAGDVEAFPTRWTLIDDFGEASKREQGALMSLSEGIERWRSRCLGAAEVWERDEPLRVVRQEGAPFVMAYWPQRRSLYINPALMALWARQSVEPRQEEIRMKSSGLNMLSVGSLDACIEELSQQCTLCTEGFATANPEQCEPIFELSPLHEDCEVLSALEDGFLKFCAHTILERRPRAVGGCFKSASTETLCGLPGDVNLGTVEVFGQHYGGFSDSTSRMLCRSQLEACMEAPVDNNGVVTEPELQAEPWEPETLEGQCWSFTLNDTGLNDVCGGAVGKDLCYYDPKRPDSSDSVCDDQQPTNCCGEQGEYSDTEQAR